jgi:hypothetical protein
MYVVTIFPLEPVASISSVVVSTAGMWLHCVGRVERSGQWKLDDLDIRYSDEGGDIHYITHQKDGGSRSLQNVGNHLQDCIMS